MPVRIFSLSRHFSVCVSNEYFLWFFVRHHRNKMEFFVSQTYRKSITYARTPAPAPAHTLILPVLYIHDELYLRCKQMNANVSCCLHARAVLGQSFCIVIVRRHIARIR